jgi:hypothetical protein
MLRNIWNEPKKRRKLDVVDIYNYLLQLCLSPTYSTRLASAMDTVSSSLQRSLSTPPTHTVPVTSPPRLSTHHRKQTCAYVRAPIAKQLSPKTEEERSPAGTETGGKKAGFLEITGTGRAHGSNNGNLIKVLYLQRLFVMQELNLHTAAFLICMQWRS